jgi:succinoglycan biosynthesis protein ExoW
MDAGCDFYFSNHFDYSGETTRFGRLEALGTFRPGDHPTIFPDKPIRWFSGNFVDQLIRDFLVQTATVVLRRDLLGELRFPVDLKKSGEDHLFWLKISEKGPKIAFSEEIECRLGLGVNIYEGSGWGTEGALQRAVDYCGINSLMRREFANSRDQNILLSERLAVCRREFIRILIHDISRGRKVSWGLVSRQLRYEPLTALTLFSEMARIAIEKISPKK